MSGVDEQGWPVARLDRLDRLRVLAAGLPGAVLEERRLDVPFDEAWAWIADLERSVPSFDRAVGALRIAGERAGRLDVRARGPRWLPLPTRFDVDLSEGWCWMVTRPRAYVVAMAAEPTADGTGTRYLHLEGLAVAAPRPLLPLVRAVLCALRARHRRHIRHDVDGIVRGVGGG